VVESSSSESESSDEEPPSPPVKPHTYQELQNYQEQPQSIPQPKLPKLKFAFA
jgi:hypothetical protein